MQSPFESAFVFMRPVLGFNVHSWECIQVLNATKVGATLPSVPRGPYCAPPFWRTPHISVIGISWRTIMAYMGSSCSKKVIYIYTRTHLYTATSLRSCRCLSAQSAPLQCRQSPCKESAKFHSPCSSCLLLLPTSRTGKHPKP